MTLSSRTKNKLVDQINMLFDDIGYGNGTRMPRSGRNNEPAAWKLFIAQHLVSRANKLKEKAEAEAVRANVIFDRNKEPRPGGTRETVFSGEIVTVSLEVRSPSERVNADEVIEYLRSKGVRPALLDAAREAGTKWTKPAHVFTTNLVVEDTSGK